MDLQDNTLRWFFDDATLDTYSYFSDDLYPLTVNARNQTANDIVGGVNITIISADPSERLPSAFSFNSTLTVNITALQRVGVSIVECGSVTAQRSRILLMKINGLLYSSTFKNLL